MIMTLAKRIRDCRYAKGWGPDELASRAAISRTALYQIECGKTEAPRAATLRRIAEALEIPIDSLMEDVEVPALAEAEPPAEASGDVMASSKGPLAADHPELLGGEGRARSSLEALDIISREAIDTLRPRRVNARRRDLDRKFHELLASPMGEAMARMVDDWYRLLPMWRGKRSI
jgi:transcriptional regulator with XRE-family HTH domain